MKQIQEARSVAASFGDCVVKRNAPVARWVILSNLPNGNITREAGKLIDGDCLSRSARLNDEIQMKFRGDLFRYTMAGALVRADYSDPDDFDFSDKPPLAHCDPSPVDTSLRGKKLKKAQEDHDEDRHFAVISRFGECVARRDPKKVHALLKTEVNGPAEGAAFQELGDALGSCLSEGEVKFGREVLRGTLAVNFYRLAGPPAGAPVATPKVVN